MPRRSAAALAALCLAAGCVPAVPGDGGEPTIAMERGWVLPGSRWQLAVLDGAAYPARLVGELTTDGRVVGEGPCNRFSAPYAGRWPDLSFDPVLTTRRSCPEVEAEASALAALARVERAAVDDGRLVLTGPGGVYLAFDPI
jgi:heat shock protein HslJ